MIFFFTEKARYNLASNSFCIVCFLVLSSLMDLIVPSSYLDLPSLQRCLGHNAFGIALGHNAFGIALMRDKVS